MKSKNLKKRLTIWAAIVAVILMIPLIARALWSLGDYIVAGVVLFSSAAGYEIASSKMENKAYRSVTASVAIGFVVFVWFLAVSGP